MATLATAKALFTGINITALFYKLLVYIALLVVACTLSYREGVSDTKEKQLNEQLDTLTMTIHTERTTLIKELERRDYILALRLNEIGLDSKQAAKLKQDLNRIQGDLYEAINARPANELCSPSDDELRQYEELAKRTATPTR